MKKIQIPISNFEIPAYRQAGIQSSNDPNSKQFGKFEFGALILFGVWNLRFGI
jgi:hypothetical protein